MWFPSSITPPKSVQTKEFNSAAPTHWIAPSTTLSRESDRLMPGGEPIEISALDEYYEHIKSQGKDPREWGLFKTPKYNFAVRRPLDFVLQSPEDSANHEDTYDGIEVVKQEEDEDEPDLFLMNAAKATMIETAQAIEIDDVTLVPGIVSSYTNLGLDGYIGYSGFKAWVKVEDGQNPQNTFFLPDISSHSGTPDGEMSRLMEKAPDLGFLCTRQLCAVASWLAEVPIESRIET